MFELVSAGSLAPVFALVAAITSAPGQQAPSQPFGNGLIGRSSPNFETKYLERHDFFITCGNLKLSIPADAGTFL